MQAQWLLEFSLAHWFSDYALRTLSDTFGTLRERAAQMSQTVKLKLEKSGQPLSFFF
ncbi:MAG: hypothetical protein V7K69_01340 [Nostoc sp.]